MYAPVWLALALLGGIIPGAVWSQNAFGMVSVSKVEIVRDATFVKSISVADCSDNEDCIGHVLQGCQMVVSDDRSKRLDCVDVSAGSNQHFGFVLTGVQHWNVSFWWKFTKYDFNTMPYIVSGGLPVIPYLNRGARGFSDFDVFQTRGVDHYIRTQLSLGRQAVSRDQAVGKSCNVLHGLGGAGGLSDGFFHILGLGFGPSSQSFSFHPEVAGGKPESTIEKQGNDSGDRKNSVRHLWAAFIVVLIGGGCGGLLSGLGLVWGADGRLGGYFIACLGLILVFFSILGPVFGWIPGWR